MEALGLGLAMLQESRSFTVAHLAWFFAGTTVGLFCGILLMSLARMASRSEEEEPEEYPLNAEPLHAKPYLVLVRR